MIIIVHSETNARTVASRIGYSEYSYFFVLQIFRPLLERLGTVIEVTEPEQQVDEIWAAAAKREEACVFLCFNPPHKIPLGLRCPTIPVFAWEFDTLPNETWDDEPRHDWISVMRTLRRGIVHSEATASALHRGLGSDVLVISIPAPVWDRYDALRRWNHSERKAPTSLRLSTPFIDSRTFPLDGFERVHSKADRFARAAVIFEGQTRPQSIELDGIIYVSVFNPFDGRKRAWEMIAHFVWAFRDRPDATLLLKITFHDMLEVMTAILSDLAKLSPFLCRIIAVQGYVEQDEYDAMIAASDYVVNCSAGEGQCLPLMEFMSCGKPAIAPRNSAMADYIDERNAFVVASHPEPTIWPHDGREMLRALRGRIDFGSLILAFHDSFIVARTDRPRYRRMSVCAVDTLRRHCSDDATLSRLRTILPEWAGDPPTETGETLPRHRPVGADPSCQYHRSTDRAMGDASGSRRW